ncbi:MAG TPA: UPF0280 family protein [Terriglobales bacterium]|nr:UPF0280 family protein [Terriglobales bacterium]
MRAQVNFLADGRRLHLQDGPIDIILEAFGVAAEVKSAYDAAIRRFTTILDELCQELLLLRAQAGPNTLKPTGTTAQRMAAAVAPYARRTFITPMAAVAGAVAEEILQAMTSAAQLSKAYVNDGGDIALHLSPGEQFAIGMIDRPDRPSLFGSATLRATHPVRGIATSGWRGRSWSLGIADAVTVLADTATTADAAATIIANAVDLTHHPNVRRAPARSLAPDCDLGDLLVTCEVGDLSTEEVNYALGSGADVAQQLISESLIHSAALHLRGLTRIVSADNPKILLAQTHADGSLIHA